jgi:glycosyltransferase involved in cell wall biosynthesis
VYALAEALAHEVPVHVVRLHDWQTYWMNQPGWPDLDPEANGHLERTHKVLPTGYAGRLEWAARPFLRRMFDGWRQELRERSATEPYVVAPYPYLEPWVRNVPSDRLIYYNLDAYTLYRPERADRIREQETALVRRAGLTMCLSQHQVETLRERYPARADRIEHFPLGVLEKFLNPQPERAPEPDTVGYVGNLTDRVDWAFVDAVAKQCPDLTFRFAGGLEALETGEASPNWKQYRRRALERPNVEHLGRIPQDEVTEVYWSSAINWIPYDSEHPFNRAACPTKVMDAIAAGRSVVSTDVPECRLYPEWISIVDGPEEAAECLQAAAADPPPAEQARRQVRFAGKHTWEHRRRELLDLVDQLEAVR